MYGTLELGLELPATPIEDGADVSADEINMLVASADETCEACGNAAGVLRDDRQWWRVLCHQCDADVSTLGWREVRARYITE